LLTNIIDGNDPPPWQLNNLHTAFDEFKEMLGSSDKMLEKSKQNMKRELENNLEAYNQQV
jgi:hypothetical protein